jgi:hypothetical protein
VSAIKECLLHLNINLEDIDYVAINHNSFSNFFYKFKFIVLNKPSLNLLFKRLINNQKKK